MLTLNPVRQRQKLVLFLLSVPFSLDAKGITVIRLGYKRGTTFSLERDRIQEAHFPPLVLFFLKEPAPL